MINLTEKIHVGIEKGSTKLSEILFDLLMAKQIIVQPPTEN